MFRFFRFRSRSPRRASAPQPAPRKPGVELLESRLVPAGFAAPDLTAAGQYMLELINHARMDPVGELTRIAHDAANLGIALPKNPSTGQAYTPDEFIQAGLLQGFPLDSNGKPFDPDTRQENPITPGSKPPLAPDRNLVQAITHHLAVWLQDYDQLYRTDIHDGLPDGPPDASGRPTVTTREQRIEDALRREGLMNPQVALAGENLGDLRGPGPGAPGTPGLSPSADLQRRIDRIYETLFIDNPDVVLDKFPDHREAFLNPDYQVVGAGVVAGVVPPAGLVPPGTPNPGNADSGLDLVLAGTDFAGNLANAGNPNGFLTGTVYRDGNGNKLYDIGEGLDGVTVEVFKGKDPPPPGTLPLASTHTFGGGGYSVSLPPGDYTVKISGVGVTENVSQTVTIKALPRDSQHPNGPLAENALASFAL
jgi:hypothetical protein